MSRQLKFGLILLMLLLLASIPMAMQLETGSIEGAIRSDYDPVSKATVEARGAGSEVAVRAESDPAGYYKLGRLRPGRYSIWVTAPGHDATWVRQVIVERGETVRSDIQFNREAEIHAGL